LSIPIVSLLYHFQRAFKGVEDDGFVFAVILDTSVYAMFAGVSMVAVVTFHALRQ
jgi:hypothetical protein